MLSAGGARAGLVVIAWWPALAPWSIVRLRKFRSGD